MLSLSPFPSASIPPHGARASGHPRSRLAAVLWCTLIATALSCAGCRRTVVSAPPAQEAASVVLHAGDKLVSFEVELARTPEEHSLGLMNRPTLGENKGMLFIFERSSHQTFWMKNTLIPLDMLFIGADHKVVGVVSNAEPLTLSERSVPGVSQFVLEINGGLSDRLGIAPGSQVDFVHVPLP